MEASLDTSTPEHHIHFGSAALFVLGPLVILCSYPVAHWAPSDLGDSFFSVICLGPFIQFMRFLRQVYWGGGLPFPSGDHILSELSARTCASWVALHAMAHSFIDLHKPLQDNKAVIHEGESSMPSHFSCVRLCAIP